MIRETSTADLEFTEIACSTVRRFAAPYPCYQSIFSPEVLALRSYLRHDRKFFLRSTDHPRGTCALKKKSLELELASANKIFLIKKKFSPRGKRLCKKNGQDCNGDESEKKSNTAPQAQTPRTTVTTVCGFESNPFGY